MLNPVNLLSPDVRRDPFPTYEQLRAQAPQRVEPGGIWALSRYEDVLHALKHPELFSSAGFGALYQPSWLPPNPLADSLFTKDGPDHAKLRGLVSRAFSPKNIQMIEPRIRQIAHECASDLLTGDSCDFIERFAVPFPARVIAEILGLDPALHKEFRQWVDDIAMISPVPPPDDLAKSICNTVVTMERYLKEVVAARRRSPGEDMVTDLVEASVDGHRLTDEEIVSFLFLLLPAGFETTRHLFAHIMMGFLDRPGDLEKLRADRSIIPEYVEEVLRYQPSVHGIFRLTTQDVEIGGVTIPQGSMTVLLVGAALRDQAQYPGADHFDVKRSHEIALPFGYGAHFCMGAPLARREARIGIEQFVERFRGFERGPGEVTWNFVPTVRGPNVLPIRAIAL